MPIIDRTPRKCHDRFLDHLRKLISSTISKTQYFGGFYSGTDCKLSFRNGDEPCTIPIQTKFGRLHLYIGQLVRAEPDGGQYRLETRQYWYRIQATPGQKEKALLRWEYNQETASDGPCRHHGQFMAATTTPELDLNKLHLPTGYVTIEEVIRFLIVDAGVAPPCGAEWHGVLREAERKFREEFTSKLYRGPGKTSVGPDRQ